MAVLSVRAVLRHSFEAIREGSGDLNIIAFSNDHDYDKLSHAFDQAAKKVMENATMAMKFSQLNREGAKEHTHSHSQDPSMPPLKSGGMFSKSLREINMKVSIMEKSVVSALTIITPR